MMKFWTKILHIWHEKVKILQYFTEGYNGHHYAMLYKVIMDIITLRYSICKPLAVYQCIGIISLPDSTSCDK